MPRRIQLITVKGAASRPGPRKPDACRPLQA